MKLALRSALCFLPVLFLVGCSDDPITLNASAQTDAQGNIYITNNDIQDWIGVELKLNGDYIHVVDVLSAGKRIALPLREFTLDDGTRFNPVATKVLQLTISACIQVEGDGDRVLCSDGYGWGFTSLVWE